MKRLLPILLLVFSVGVGAESDPIRHMGGLYYGEVVNGVPNGAGTWSRSDGFRYAGGWRDGKWHGHGALTAPGGVVYVGKWKDFKKHGQGTMTWSDGHKYVGAWKENEKHGQGTTTWVDGSKQFGEYNGGLLWRGSTYNASGEIIERRSDGLPARACDGVELTGRGTGFAVNQHHVVTNAHVLFCCKKVTVRQVREGACSDEMEATVIATAQRSDLGLLRVNKPIWAFGLPKYYATFRRGMALERREVVFVYDDETAGYQGRICPQYVFERGRVAELNWRPDDSRLMKHTAPTQAGSSGGPVLDGSGHIVGVTESSILEIGSNNETALAVNLHLLETFLTSNRVEYKTAPSTEELSIPEIKERLDEFTVQVECLQ